MHRNLRTTGHYAKIPELKASEDMVHLKNKLSNNESWFCC